MIGVLTSESELPFAREFFEIFKTPWEPAKPFRHYPALVSCGHDVSEYSADVHIVFSSKEAVLDRDLPCAIRGASGAIEWDGFDLPIHGDLASFQTGEPAIPLLHSDRVPVAFWLDRDGAPLIRLGYDLFKEVEFLLSKGQPRQFAATPTLDLHVSLVRSLILWAGVPLVEIAAHPDQVDFITCLTHDIDFHDIARHRFDATMWGFLFRATIGSLIAGLRGRMPWNRVVVNWKAAALLPCVHLGWAKDPWKPFSDYPKVENCGSTFFVIPFADRPGRSPSGSVETLRASKYGAADIGEEVVDAASAGHEIAVHGLEAWRDASLGSVERARVNRVAGRETLGLRMHWLYFDERSPALWEEAGFTYDSSVGYNDAVGFRSGTCQVYRPPGLSRLLELPLHIQDTALFFRDRMSLREDEAQEVCRRLIHCLNRFGGVLTVNWHDRSLAPERQWGEFYRRLLNEIRKHRVWFAKASEAVGWFAQRRAIEFRQIESMDRGSVTRVFSRDRISPPVTVRIHRPRPGERSPTLENVELEFVDESFAGGGEKLVAFPGEPYEQLRRRAPRRSSGATASLRDIKPLPQKQP